MVSAFFIFSSGKMSANLAGIIESRDSILSKIEQAVTYASEIVFTVMVAGNIMLHLGYKKKLIGKV